MFLASVIPAVTAHAAGAEEALCRGTYPVLLMTEQECRSYIRQVKALQSTGQVHRVGKLAAASRRAIGERAAICPMHKTQTPSRCPAAPRDA